MLKKKCFFITLSFFALVSAKATAGALTGAAIANFSKEKFVAFHLKAIEVALIKERITNYPSKLSAEGMVSQNPSFEVIKELLIPSAQALAVESTCYFGGWPSYVVDGVCKTPWTFAGHGELETFGPTYSSDYYCGGQNLFRCNPVLFGEGSSGKGECIEIPNYENVTQQCFEKSKETAADLYEKFRLDPEFHRNYINMADEMLNFCSEAQDYSACQYLLASVKSAQSFVCGDRYLDELVGSERFKELENTWTSVEGLMIKNEGVAKRIGERVESEVTRSALPAVLSEEDRARIPASGDFANYSNSPEVRKLLSELHKGATTCNPTQNMRDSGKFTACRAGGSKGVDVSIGACLRYVKKALDTSGIVPYTGEQYASNSGEMLEAKGFINLLSSDEYSGMKSNDQRIPAGAILVYESTNSRKGTPGHIEVKTDDGKYISDFIGNNPRDIRYIRNTSTKKETHRKLIGVYINPSFGE